VFYLVSDFSSEVPFTCAGGNYPGPFIIMSEWSAYISKDSYASLVQNGQICPGCKEEILVFTTLGQKMITVKKNDRTQEKSSR